jgi:hypothetical protein
MLHFLIGLALMAVGIMITLKSEAMLNAWGRIQWCEDHLGIEGGSRLGYKLIGLLVFFIGLLLATGLYSGFMQGLLSPIINAGKPK